nr:hypothetical protein [Tanacetum cinerariifolium]
AKNLLSYWGKYVTHAKNNINMSTVTYVDIFTHLRTYEEHALKSLKKKEQSSAVVDPLAYLAKTTLTHSTTLPVTVPKPQSSEHALKSLKKKEQSSAVVDPLAYLAKTTLTHSTTLPVTVPKPQSSGDSHNDAIVNAIPTVVSADEADKQYIIAVLQRMHTEIASYVKVNDEHKLVNATLTVELQLCKIEMQALEHNKVKHDLDMAIVERNKQNVKLEEENMMLKSTLKSKVVFIENLQQESIQVLSEKKTLKDKYLEEIIVLTNANKVAKNVLKGFQIPTHTILMLSKRPNFASYDLHKTGLGYSNPRYSKQARITQPALYDGHVLLNPNHPPTRVHDSEESLVYAEVCKFKMTERPGHALPINYAKLNTMYDQFVPQKELSREHVYWLLAAEIASQSSTPAKHALETELTQLKDAVTSLKIQHDGYKVINANFNRCYEELSKVNTHLRTTSLEKIATQKAEIATLNAKTVGNKTSVTTKPTNPKVIAPGMYAISPKYIVHQRKTNRETHIPLPKKKQVTFQETPKPSPRFTKKQVAPLLKKPNVNVPLSTGIKSATGDSKPASKSNA